MRRIGQPAVPEHHSNGVEVYAADTAEMARSALSSLTGDEDVGMVAIDVDLYNALDGRTRARLESRCRPVVMAIPAPTRMAPGERDCS